MVVFDRKTTLCVKYFGQDCLRKQFFASNWPPGPFKFDLTILVSLRTLIQFYSKIRAINLVKRAEICFI